MARRSPMNERYQKNTAPAGKTRKSAASAKPKRSGGTGTSSKPVAKKERPSAILPNPDTAEFRYWRRIWWVTLIASAVFTFGSLGIRQWMGQQLVANVMLFVGYALIFGALAIDWLKIRKLRNEWVESQKKSGK